MDNGTDVLINSCEITLKFNKKLVRGYFLWVIFNISLLLFDWQTFNSSPSHMTACAFGAMTVTALWSLFFLLEYWNEYRDNKQRLRFLKELQDRHMASDELQQYKNSNMHYESFLKKIINDPEIKDRYAKHLNEWSLS